MGFSQFFLDSSIATFGTAAALVASPIIIHLINRMRFRKVRFAAMEFLLQAQQRNRRRLLLEQLLLLLLRILIVLALLALIARLILDPRLTVFGGEGKAHHLVVLDDSASMQNRWGNTTAFEEAKKVILTLAKAGAKRPQTQTFSLVLLSKPNDFLFADVDVSEELVKDLQDKLDPETLKASNKRPDLQAGLEAAGKHLRKHEATIKHLHVFSDFRKNDWQGKEALGETISQLEEDGISINLVRCVEQPLPNLGITTLEGDLHSVAAGVPVRLRIGVTNFGTQAAKNISVTLVQDGDKLPLSVTFDEIEPGKELVRPKDITFKNEGLHRVRIELEEDSLSADNARFLSIDIPKQNHVLIVTAETSEAANPSLKGLKNALMNDPALTGIATNVVQADFLDKELEQTGVNQIRSIYMLNVPEIPAKALPLLEDYVRRGGGLVWFLGEKVNVEAYNKMSKLEPDKEGVLARPENEQALFPVLLDNTTATMSPDPTIKTPDWNFVSHPIFNVTFSKLNPLISAFMMTEFLPVAKEWVKDDAKRKDGITTVGYTREGEPIVFDHRFGKGRVMTFLTSIGPPWNNLIEIGALILPLMQNIQQYVAKPDEERHVYEIGDRFEKPFSALDYDSKLKWQCPDSSEPESTMQHPKLADGTENTDLWLGEFDHIDSPGIYRYIVTPKNNRKGNDLPSKGEFAANVSPTEGHMAIATDAQIQEHLGEESRLAIHAFGETDFLTAGTDPGQEVRKYLMYLLLFLLVAEQAMAYRLSYHPETVEAAA